MADLSLDSSLVLRIKGDGLATEDVERAMAAELERQGYAKDNVYQRDFGARKDISDRFGHGRDQRCYASLRCCERE